MKKLVCAGLIAAAALISSAAQATVVFSYAGPYTPAQPSPGGLYNPAPFGGTGAALLTFTIDGYASLDGANSYEDDFTLNLNGVDILKGTFDMGGGGANIVFFAPAGSVITPTSFGFFAGGKTDFSVPITLNGSNTLTWSYTSPGPDNGPGGQGVGDESWSLQDVTVNTLGVPEPATWALMIGGFGMAGAALRRRRAIAA